MATFAERYGQWAAIAGASEGLGEAFARGCAGRGLNVVLIARRVELAQQIAEDIAATTGVQTRALRADLADRDDLDRILADLIDLDVGLLSYNAAFSVVGPFWNFDIDTHLKEVDVNVRGPLVLSHGFGERFRARGRGGIILLSSMGALQGMVKVTNYSATKAYNLVLAEGLWAELRDDGVDVLVSCAGATRTPNYIASEPEDSNVPVQEPEQVAAETLNALGKKPTLFPARVLRVTHFAFRHLMGRRTAVRLMAYASNRAYKEQGSYSTGDRG
jgi:short-subunit dehydrogenase